MSDVFISYSREDKTFVALLREAFLKQSQEVWIDWESIPASQSWWDEIKRGIATANNFVVVMSPNSLSSPICHLEIEYARSLGKRIIPVFHAKADREVCLMGITKRLANTDSSQDITRDLWGNRQSHTIFDENQKALAPINYFFFTPDDNFDEKFDKLLDIIQTDFKHKEIHTRIGLRAGQWASRDRDVSFLLIGQELKDAETWLDEALKGDKNPPLTELQTEYIRAGRTDEDARFRRLQAIRRARLVASVTAGIMLLFAIGATLVGVNATNDATIAVNNAITATFAQGKALVNAQQAQALADNANAQVATANLQLATATQALATGTAVAQDLADAEATLEVVNTQVFYAQATITQAVILEDIIANFANTLLLNRNNPIEQIAQMNALVELYPNEAEVYVFRGAVFAQVGKFDEAIADYDQAITINPHLVIAYYNRGITLYNSQEYERAVTDFTQAITLNPQFVDAYVYRALAYTDLGDFDRAIADSTQALALNPQINLSTIINLQIEDTFIYLENPDLGDSNSAITYYTQAITRNPRDILAYFSRGLVYEELGDFDRAIADYTQIIAINPQSSDAYNNRGYNYYLLGDYENALIDCNQAIAIDSENDYAYMNLGLIYRRLAEGASDSVTRQEYVALGLEAIGMAQSLGYTLNAEDGEAFNRLQSMFVEITPTP